MCRADANLNTRGSVPGPWSDRLPHFRLDSVPSAGGDELQSEWFVGRRHAVAGVAGAPVAGGADHPAPACSRDPHLRRRRPVAQPRLPAGQPVHRLHLAQPSGRGRCTDHDHRGRPGALRAAPALGEAGRLSSRPAGRAVPSAGRVSGHWRAATTQPASFGTRSWTTSSPPPDREEITQQGGRSVCMVPADVPQRSSLGLPAQRRGKDPGQFQRTRVGREGRQCFCRFRRPCGW